MGKFNTKEYKGSVYGEENLGNKMWEYASLVGLAAANRRELAPRRRSCDAIALAVACNITFRQPFSGVLRNNRGREIKFKQICNRLRF